MVNMNVATPKVSICCITYNHEKYIRETLDSFLMQEVNFSFEIIVGDDCSTDGTRAIIKEYEKKYPQIVKPIFREKNIGAQKNFVDTFSKTKGDYIALCEGDDFWTDTRKLQKQVDFLSRNLEYSLCFHPVRVFFENNDGEESIYPRIDSTTEFSLDQLVNNNFIQTNSVLYRRVNYDDLPINILPMDWYMHLFHAKHGKIGFINDIMSAYRRHEGGIWWDSYNDMDSIWLKYGVEHFSMFCEMYKLFNNSVSTTNEINRKIYRTYGILLDVDRKYKVENAKKALKLYPESIDPLVNHQEDSIRALEESRYQQEELINQLKVKINDLEVDLIQKNDELRNIKSSKAWKLLDKSRRYKGKVIRRN